MIVIEHCAPFLSFVLSSFLMQTPAVTLDSLSRTFGAKDKIVRALDRVTLEIAEGDFVALLGENGAGKTTLAKVLSTLLSPSSGVALVHGLDVVRHAADVRSLTTAIFGGDRGLYGMLSAVDNLRCFGSIYRVSRRELRRRIPEVLELVGLDDSASRLVREFSKGMKQRLHIAIGLLTRPSLLLLDEPTVGLDPNEAARLRETIAQMNRDGTTVLLTSHNLADVDRLARRVLVLNQGRITNDLTLDEFRNLAGAAATVTALSATPPATAKTLFAESPPVETPEGFLLTLPIKNWSAEVLRDLADAVDNAQIEKLRIRESSLDEAFASATDKGSATLQ